MLHTLDVRAACDVGVSSREEGSGGAASRATDGQEERLSDDRLPRYCSRRA